MKKNLKKAYVSLEVVIICAVVLTAGIGCIAHFWTDGKSNQSVMVEKQEEVYYAAWNGDQGETGGNIGGGSGGSGNLGDGEGGSQESGGNNEPITHFIISFNGNGGSNTTKNVLIGQPIGDLPISVRDGYLFNGWFTAKEGGTQITKDTVPTENSVYYAQWIEINYSYTAYAIVHLDNEGNNILTFTRSETPIQSGDIYNGQTVIASYTGFEENKTRPWGSYGSSIIEVNFDHVIKPISTAKWFYEFKNCESINGINKLITSDVQDMSYMFAYCNSLEILDTTNWNLNNLVDAQYMFYYCGSLTNLDTSNWTPNKLTNTKNMFADSNITNLDLSGFDMSQVTNASYMFTDMHKLETVIFGEKWKWVGSNGYLPVTYSSYIEGANGKWYSDDGSMYTPSGLATAFNANPTEMAGRYTAIAPYNPTLLKGETFNRKIPSEATSVIFTDIIAPNNVTVTDVSDYQNKSVVGWLDGTTWYISSQRDGVDVIANQDSSKMFQSKSKLQTVDAERLDMSKATNISSMFAQTAITELKASSWRLENVIDASSMFAQNSKIKTLNAGNWTFGKVTDISHMFYYCKSLINVDMSNWNLDNVTDISYIFFECNEIEEIDATSWGKLENVINAESMFWGCTKLTTLDTSNWMFGKVTNTNSIFYDCTNLLALDTSNWDLSNVTTAAYMFYGCKNLTTLDASNWGISEKITNMQHMFYYCEKLETLDTSEWNLEGLTNARNMFAGCKKIKTFDTTNWGTLSNLSISAGMFSACESLETLDTSSWILESMKDAKEMFKGCSSLKILDTTNWGTLENLYNANSMFSGCINLTTLNTSNWTLKGVSDAGSMFSGCNNLTVLDTGNWILDNMITANGMFAGCKKIETLDTTNWGTLENVTYTGAMFSECENLKTLDTSRWTLEKVTSTSAMFYRCSALKTIDVSGWNLENVVDVSSMFYYCYNLTTLDTSNWSLRKMTNANRMFENCRNLTTLDVSNWGANNLKSTYFMFGYCHSLTTLDTSKWDTSSLIDTRYMFYSCPNLKGTITIYNNPTQYSSMFLNTSTEPGSEFIVNYISATETMVDTLIATKSTNSNVIKANSPLQSHSISVENDGFITDINNQFPNKSVKIIPMDEMNFIKSFKLNGVKINGDSFIMPNEDVVITDIEAITCSVIESEHKPYPNNISSKIYGEQTFEGATSLTVILDYQTENANYDWIYLYDSSTSTSPIGNKKYGGSTRITETITINGNYVKIVFRTDGSGNNYYGFKATIVPNY